MRQIKLESESELMLISASSHHPHDYVRRKSQMLLNSHRGLSVSEIAESYSVGLRHVYRLFNAWEKKGLLGLYIMPGRGSKSVIDWSSLEVESSLEKHVSLHPQNLSKVAEQMSLDTGKPVSKRMVQRNLKKKRYSWKRMRKSLKPLQDEQQYQTKLVELLYLTILAKIGYIDMYFGDESYFNLSPEVPYGWQKINEHIKIVPRKKTSHKIFGLLSREKEELYTYEAKKNINSAFIIESIQDFATKINQRTVIVLDNAATHSSKLMQAQILLWKEQDIEIFFLPKYSPHLNLIETCWRKIKYEWLEPSDYDTQEALAIALKRIFDNYGSQYNIHFSEFTNSKLLFNFG